MPILGDTADEPPGRARQLLLSVAQGLLAPNEGAPTTPIPPARKYARAWHKPWPVAANKALKKPAFTGLIKSAHDHPEIFHQPDMQSPVSLFAQRLFQIKLG
jgi:hypothetical protein